MAFSKVILNGTTLIDLTDTTAEANQVKTGETFYTAGGLKSTGTYSGGSSVYYQDTIDSAGGTVRNIIIDNVNDWRKDDGKTYLHIAIDSNYFLTVNLRFQQSVNNGNTIDWGDGSTVETISGTSKQTLTHTYLQQGEYIIKITNSSGKFYFGENNITLGYIFQDGTNNLPDDKYKHYCRILKKLELGSGWACDVARQFQACHELTDVYINSIPEGTTWQGNMFNECKSLKSFIWKTNVMDSVTSLPTAPFTGCFSMKEPIFFPKITSLPQNYMIGSSYVRSSLKKLIIPNGITTIGQSAFRYCQGVTEIDIPATVTSIGATAFGDALSIHAIHIRATTPPTLSNTNAFTLSSSIYNPIIYVPANSLTDYQNDTNWGTLSSYMQAES